VLDCFTCGKGTCSPVFMKFYEEGAAERRTVFPAAEAAEVKPPDLPGHALIA
jgi:hypothetical protein